LLILNKETVQFFDPSSAHERRHEERRNNVISHAGQMLAGILEPVVKKAAKIPTGFVVGPDRTDARARDPKFQECSQKYEAAT
jgi:hypothetical protein